MIAEFKGFLLKSNALGLAVGVIFAAALGLVVGSLVNDIIMPPIGYLLGGVNFADLKIVLGTTTNAEGQVTEVAIRWGAFVNTLINFTIIAFIAWRITKLFLKVAPADEVKTCPFCKEANAVDATRCKACTSEI
jgi:large conductance mechanosensitive channel